MSNQIAALMEMSADERTQAQRDALQLHEQLIYDRQMVELGIVSLCRDLKDIRDGKHYETLGFADFGEYTEQIHGIGARQAYKYIRVYEKLGIEILNSSSKIGVTKLLELASLDNDERQELLAEHPIEELENMSTAEVKRLTDQVRKLEEQLNMFENATPELTEAERAGLEAMYKTELDGKYADKIADLESSLESVKKDLIISEGENAQSEKEYDELQRKYNDLSNEHYRLKNSTDSVLPLAGVKPHLSLLSNLLSSIRYGNAYWSLSEEDQNSVKRDIYDIVSRYFGEKK